MSLPEGFGYVPGRSRATAIKLLDSAAEIDADVTTAVRTVRDGYHVQDDVLENYSAKLADEDVAIGGDTETKTEADTGSQPAATETAQSETSGTENATSETENATSGAENATNETSGTENATSETEKETSGTEAETSTETETATAKVEQPNKNASTAAWLEFAKASAGWNEADKEMSRNELAEKYGSK